MAAALAQNLVSIWYKALAHQGGGAAGTGKAAVVPVSVFEGHILASTCPLAAAPTCDGTLAAAALGCKEFSKAGHTVGIIVPRCELLPRKGCLAPSADQALSMPGLIAICHSTLGQRLAAAGTPRSKFVLIARHAVVSTLVRHEGAGAQGLLTATAQKAVFMPRLASILQLPGPGHDSLPTGRTLGREGCAVALITEKLTVLTGEGLISQGALAAAAAEAALVEVAVLIKQFPRIMPDELLALGTGVGKGVVVAGNTVGAAVCLDVFAAVQGLIAFRTVKCFTHGGGAQ